VFGHRIRRPGKALALIAVGAAGGGAALAVASVPGSTGAISACYVVTALPGSGTTVPVSTPGNVRIIDPSAGQTCSSGPAGAPQERLLTWNQTGPPGLRGQTGAPGQTQTILGGNTITIGGAVVTVGRSSGLTLAPAPIGRRTFAQMRLGSGSGALSFGILGVSFTNGSQGSSSGAGAGKGKLQALSITKSIDKTSPKLAQACANGTHFSSAIILVAKSGHSLTYKLSGVLVSSYQLGGASGQSGVPHETLTFSFAKLLIQGH
jgi:Type VI secretion system effector, Hcp